MESVFLYWTMILLTYFGICAYVNSSKREREDYDSWPEGTVFVALMLACVWPATLTVSFLIWMFKQLAKLAEKMR